jgi:hypothetical protein
MNNCCPQIESYLENICPVNGKKGKKVALTTLKSLLKPTALALLNPQYNYYFCNSENCEVAYFFEKKQIYNIEDLKIAIWQKKSG